MRSAIQMLSSNRTSDQVGQTPHIETFGDLPQPHGAGRNETAQQTIAAKPLHPGLPVPGARTQPVEDPSQLRRERRLSLAKGNRISRKAAKAQKKTRKESSK
jgi:hypothetical protein